MIWEIPTMDAITVKCDSCGTSLKVRSSAHIGRKGQCPHCGNSTVLRPGRKPTLAAEPTADLQSDDITKNTARPTPEDSVVGQAPLQPARTKGLSVVSLIAIVMGSVLVGAFVAGAIAVFFLRNNEEQPGTPNMANHDVAKVDVPNPTETDGLEQSAEETTQAPETRDSEITTLDVPAGRTPGAATTNQTGGPAEGPGTEPVPSAAEVFERVPSNKNVPHQREQAVSQFGQTEVAVPEYVETVVVPIRAFFAGAPKRKNTSDDADIQSRLASQHVQSVKSVLFSPDGQFMLTGDALIRVANGTGHSKGKANFVTRELRPNLTAGTLFNPNADGGFPRHVSLEGKNNGSGHPVAALFDASDVFKLANLPRDQKVAIGKQNRFGSYYMALIPGSRQWVKGAAAAGTGQKDLRFSALARAHDGKTIALAVMHNVPGQPPRHVSIELYDATSLKLKKVLKAQDNAFGAVNAESPVVQMGISPNGRKLSALSGDGMVTIWDMDSGESVRTQADHKWAGNWKTRPIFAVSTDSHWLVTGTGNRLEVWNLETGKRERELEMPAQIGPIYGRCGTLQFGDGGRTLLAAFRHLKGSNGIYQKMQYGVVIAWDSETWRPKRVYRLVAPDTNEAYGQEIFVSPETISATGTAQYVVSGWRVWDLRQVVRANGMQQLSDIQGKSKKAKVVSCSTDQFGPIPNAEHGGIAVTLETESGTQNAVDFAGLSLQSQLHVASLIEFQRYAREKAEFQKQAANLRNPAGRFQDATIVSSARNAAARLEHYATYDLDSKILSHDQFVFSADSKNLLHGVYGKLRMWDLATKEEEVNLDTNLRFGNLESMILPDASQLVDAHGTGIWDLNTGEKRNSTFNQGSPDHRNWLITMQFLPNGLLLAHTKNKKDRHELYTIDSQTDEIVGRYKSHVVQQILPSRVGDLLAVIESDFDKSTAILLLDSKTLSVRTRLQLPQKTIEAKHPSFSADTSSFCYLHHRWLHVYDTSNGRLRAEPTVRGARLDVTGSVAALWDGSYTNIVGLGKGRLDERFKRDHRFLTVLRDGRTFVLGNVAGLVLYDLILKESRPTFELSVSTAGYKGVVASPDSQFVAVYGTGRDNPQVHVLKVVRQ